MDQATPAVEVVESSPVLFLAPATVGEVKVVYASMAAEYRTQYEQTRDNQAGTKASFLELAVKYESLAEFPVALDG